MYNFGSFNKKVIAVLNGLWSNFHGRYSFGLSCQLDVSYSSYDLQVGNSTSANQSSPNLNFLESWNRNHYIDVLETKGNNYWVKTPFMCYLFSKVSLKLYYAHLPYLDLTIHHSTYYRCCGCLYTSLCIRLILEIPQTKIG